MAGELINIVFYLAVFVFATLFSLFGFTFSPAKTTPDQAWKGPLFSGLAFVFWTVLASVHSYICAEFDATGLIVLAFLWYLLAVVFLILMVVYIWQTFSIRKARRDSEV